MMKITKAQTTRCAAAALLLALLAALAAAGCDRNTLTSGERFRPEKDDDPGEPPPAGDVTKAKINEIMLENTATLEDDRGGFPAWLEIHNPTAVAMDLAGLGLSNEILKPTKWTFPATPESVIPAGEFLVVFIDGDVDDPNDLHASFTIAPGTQFQIIFNKGSDLFTFDGSKLGKDVSAGRFPDSGARINVLAMPTPGAPNSEHSGPPPEGEFIRGDLNGDGRASVSDIAVLAMVLNGAEPPPRCQDIADVDDDGIIDAADSEYLGAALFLNGPSIPPPHPAMGLDPTPDGLSCPP
jgi:hypothetical protein